MSIKKTLLAGVAGTLFTGGAMAAEPVHLTDQQMDDVSAGLSLTLALGLTSGFLTANTTTAAVEETAQGATVESINIGTLITVVNTTQSLAGTGFNLTSATGGGIIVIGPSLGVSGTLSFDEP